MREKPKKSLGCRLGFHWWSRLTLLDRRMHVLENDKPKQSWFTPFGQADDKLAHRRHCLLCGKVEVYFLENNE